MHVWINKQLPGDWWLHWDLYWIIVGIVFVCSVAILFQLTNKIVKNENARRWTQTGIALVACLLPISYCFVSTTKSMFLEYLIIAGISIYSIYKCEYLSFHVKEHICILGLLMITTAHGYGIIMEDMTIIPLLLFIILFVKMTCHSLKSNWLNIWIYTLTICFHIWLFRKIYYALFKDLNYYLAYMFGKTSIIRIGFFLLVGVLFVVFSLGMVYLEKKYLGNWYESIRTVSQNYPVIDWYFIIAIVFDCALLWGVNHIHGLFHVIDEQYKGYFYTIAEWGGILIIAVQFLFVTLLTQVSEQKIRIRRQELQNENMLTYHQKLEENLTEIRAMKHDLKNVFLTMGEYVNRSADEELKAFYQEAIYPLADKEIRMNDCFVALERICNDQVKAFLFYKLSFGINSDIDMKLLISAEDKQVHIPADWEFVEMLVRILGIWLDNALEECAAMKEEAGEVSPQCLIKIKQNGQLLQFQVENTVRKSVCQHGIEKGITTKGLGRGNGLLYVDKLMKKIENGVWNSYFKDERYIQSIMFDLSKQ